MGRGDIRASYHCQDELKLIERFFDDLLNLKWAENQSRLPLKNWKAEANEQNFDRLGQLLAELTE